MPGLACVLQGTACPCNLDRGRRSLTDKMQRMQGALLRRAVFENKVEQRVAPLTQGGFTLPRWLLCLPQRHTVSRLLGRGPSLVVGKRIALLRFEDTLFDQGRQERSDLPWKAEWLWLSSKSSPVGKLQLAGGLTELLCSTAGQFSLVLQLGHKSFYFPQAQASVLYTAHHLIKESKVTELVKVILPFHVQHW